MPISIACECGKKLQVRDDLAGKKVKCPGCQSVLTVPSGGAAPVKPAAKPVAPAAKPTVPAAKPAAKASPVEPPKKAAPVKAKPVAPKPAPAMDDDFGGGFPFGDDDEPAPTPARKPAAPAGKKPAAAPAAASKSAPKKKAKSGGGAWIALLLLLLLLGGGGFAGYWFFIKPQNDANKGLPPIVQNDGKNKGQPPVIPPQPPENSPENPIVKPPIVPPEPPAKPNIPPEPPIKPINPEPPVKPVVPPEPPVVKADPLEKFLTSSIPNQTAVFLQVRVSDWWNGKSGKSVQQLPPVQEWLKIAQSVGAGPGDIEQVRISVLPPPADISDPNKLPAIAVLIAKKAMNWDEVRMKIPVEWKEVEVAGKKTFATEGDKEPLLIYPLSDKVVVVALEGEMKDLFENGFEFGKSPLSDLTEPVKGRHIVIAGNLKVVPPELSQKIPPLPQTEAALKASDFVVAFNDNDKFEGSILINFPDDKAAEALIEQLNGFAKMGEALLNKLAASPELEKSPEMKKLLDLGTATIESLKIGHKDTVVDVQFAVPAGLGDLVPFAMQWLTLRMGPPMPEPEPKQP